MPRATLRYCSLPLPTHTLTSTAQTPPRLYVLVATEAPVAVVFRHGPTDWWQIGRWELVSGDFAPGAWFRGRLYPRRSDLSPDGTLLCVFAAKSGSRPFMGVPGFFTYIAVSKLPWLFALAAWKEGSTWGRGYHFIRGPLEGRPSERGGFDIIEGPSETSTWVLGAPDHGDATPLHRRYRLAVTPSVQYAAERRRGWHETPESPPRSPNDVWDERRQAVLAKVRPRREGRLVLTDHGWSPHMAVEGRSPTFMLERRARRIPLEDVVWADSAPDGRLLVATRGGRLEIRNPDQRELPVVRAHDLAALRPEPRPAPEWAQRW